MFPSANVQNRVSAAALWSRRLGALSVPILVLAGTAHRAGIIATEALLPSLGLGFALAVAALAAGIAAFVDIWDTGAEGMREAVVGIVYALPALAILTLVIVAAIIYPRLTDISTDTLDVPQFAAPGAPADSGVDEARQARAYPRVTARFYPVSLEVVYSAVKIAVEDRNWTVIRDLPPPEPPAPIESPSADPAWPPFIVLPPLGPTGEPPLRGAAMEAAARTALFGIPDFVVVRLQETGSGTRVDLRSASSIGSHDLGQNARRIEGFLAGLDAVLQGMADADAVAAPAPLPQPPAVPQAPPPPPRSAPVPVL